MSVGLISSGLQYANQQRLTATCSKVSYAHAGGVSGCKRQRLCPPLQAKSRRRSTQGIVSHEVPAEPQVSKGGPKLDWVRCAGPTIRGLLGTICCNLDNISEVRRELEEAAEEDEDIADILQGAKGDPVIIQQRVSLQLMTLWGCAASAHVLKTMIYVFTDQGKHGRQTQQPDQ